MRYRLRRTERCGDAGRWRALTLASQVLHVPGAVLLRSSNMPTATAQVARATVMTTHDSQESDDLGLSCPGVPNEQVIACSQLGIDELI